MITKVENKMIISLTFSEEDKTMLSDTYNTLDIIDDLIQAHSMGHITDFISVYYDTILDFLHALRVDTELVSNNIAEYIYNNSIQEQEQKR